MMPDIKVIIQTAHYCEAEVNIDGSYFHLIIGKHAYGNYICIPNWDVGSELASLTDTFWNEERLQQHTGLSQRVAHNVTNAIKMIGERVTI